jgi:hypothetical protein
MVPPSVRQHVTSHPEEADLSIAPQLPMIVAFEARESERPLDFMYVGKRSCEPWEKKLNPAEGQCLSGNGCVHVRYRSFNTTHSSCRQPRSIGALVVSGCLTVSRSDRHLQFVFSITLTSRKKALVACLVVLPLALASSLASRNC